MAAPVSGWGLTRTRPSVPMRPQLAGEQCAAEQVGPDRHAVEPPFVPLWPDTNEAGLVGEQRQLNRLGRRWVLVAFGHESARTASPGAESYQCGLAGTRGKPGVSAVCGGAGAGPA